MLPLYVNEFNFALCVCALKSSLLSLGDLPMVSRIVMEQGQSLIDALLRVSSVY